MPVELALYQPDIAQNTGTLLRLGACLGVASTSSTRPAFRFRASELKRGGLDYLDHADFVEHDSYAHFDSWPPHGRPAAGAADHQSQRVGLCRRATAVTIS